MTGNFNSIANREDIGALWENFLISERIKQNQYHHPFSSPYFWRTIDQQEIDYIEEREGNINAFEFKWNPNAKFKSPAIFIKTYNTTISKIDKTNFRSFINLSQGG